VLIRGADDLEFRRVLENAAAHCQSEAGRKRLLSAAPASTLAEVEKLLDETGEGVRFWQQVMAPGGISLFQLPETSAFLDPFQEGMVPEREEILLLGRFLATDEKARRMLLSLSAEKYPRLAKLAGGITDIRARI
jgi:dsDNA-specific endonuclease/ATPase MutS2